MLLQIVFLVSFQGSPLDHEECMGFGYMMFFGLAVQKFLNIEGNDFLTNNKKIKS
jgi:hypothetical protein